MKNILFSALLFAAVTPFMGRAQTTNLSTDGRDLKKYKPSIGLKVGYNYFTLAGSSVSFDPAGKSGFMIAGFMSTGPSSGFGYRSELVYSHRGFSYTADGKKENLVREYIYLPQLTTFTIAKALQLQAGMQIGYLIHAQGPKNESSNIMSYYNRIDYGFAGGFEIYPFKGLILGGRYNASFGNLYKQESNLTTQPYPLPFNPSELKGKNSVIQLFVGFKF